MEKNYIKFYAEGNEAKKETKVISYFEKENFVVDGKILYTYEVVPEEKEVKNNAVSKARAEYVNVPITWSSKRKVITEDNEEYYTNRLFTKEDEIKAIKKIKEDIKTAYNIYSKSEKLAEVQIYSITKEGEDLTREEFSLHDFNNYMASLLFDNTPISKRIIKTEYFHIFDPEKNNNYCIVDHVNAISGSQNYVDKNGKIKNVLIEDLYSAAFKQAKEDGFSFESTYTMKKFCYALNHSKNPSKEYKTWVRNHFYPKKVYLICDNLDNFDAKYAYKCWARRKVDIMVIQADQINREYKLNSFKNDINRRVADVWGNAIGFQTSAPISRLITDNSIDIYAIGNIDKRKELIDEGVKVTKVTTRTDKFTAYNRAEASDKETTNIAYDSIWRYKSGAIDELLDIDMVVCECCGKPRNNRNHKNRFQEITDKIICPNCEAEFDDDTGLLEIDSYYEDSYKEEFDEYIDDIIESGDGYFAIEE